MMDNYCSQVQRIKIAKLWDLNGQTIQTFIGHTGEIRGLAFSKENNHIWTGDSDKTAKLWNLGTESRSLEGHTKPITALAFSLDNQYMLTSAMDNIAKLWRTDGTDTGIVLAQQNVNLVAFSPPEITPKYCLTASREGIVKLWDFKGKAQISLPYNRAVKTVHFLVEDNKDMLLVGYADGIVKLWDLASPNQAKQVFNHFKQSVAEMAFSSDGQFILIGFKEGSAEIWSVRDDQKTPIFLKGHLDSITSVAYSFRWSICPDRFREIKQRNFGI